MGCSLSFDLLSSYCSSDVLPSSCTSFYTFSENTKYLTSVQPLMRGECFMFQKERQNQKISSRQLTISHLLCNAQCACSFFRILKMLEFALFTVFVSLGHGQVFSQYFCPSKTVGSQYILLFREYQFKMS